MRSSAPVTSPRARLEDVQLAGDRFGGRRVVAGDHHGADVRPLGGGDGGLRLGPRRIDHADQAEQHEVVLDAVGQLDVDVRSAAACGSMPRAAAGTVRVAMASVRSAWPASASLRRDELGAALLVERDGLAVLPEIAALREQDFRRTLDEDAQLAGVVGIEMDGGVALALGGEGDFRDAREARQLGFADAELARRDDQRAFGRVALHLPAALAVRQRRVVGERRRAQHLRHGIAGRRRFGERCAVDGEVALRDVAAAADLDQRAGREDRPHRHLVAGQRAGLVGADHGRGAERLDRRQLAHDGVGGRHAPHAEAQPHGHDRRQRLGDRRDRERHGEQEQAENGVEVQHGAAEQPGREHDGADPQHDDAEALAGAVEFLLQRRRLLLGGFQQAGDAADLGRHAGRDDHGAAAAIGGDRAREQHVAAVAEADIGVDRPASPCVTGTLSPVRGASSVWRLALSMMRASAGILSPASTSTMSPGTMSWAAMRWRSPSRITVEFRGGKGHQRAHRLLGPRLLEDSRAGRSARRSPG